MKKSKFTEAQTAFELKQAEAGTAIAEVCRKARIAEATFYNWRKKFGRLMPSEMRRLKQLEDENTKLKRLVADPSSVDAVLANGAARAHAIADPILQEAKDIVGFLRP